MNTTSANTAPASASTGPVPLSHAQRRMWLMDRLGGAGAAYSVPFATRLRGPLDLDALAAALTAVVRRHTALRTRFAEHDGEPSQQTLPAPDRLALTVEECPEATAPARLAEEARRPFDLAAGALPRALVLRHGERDHTVLLTFHHISVDGASLATVATELTALYTAARHGGEPGLEQRPPSYADHARRESAAAHTDGLRHWTGRLAGAAPVRLPRPAPGAPGAAGTAVHPLADGLPEALRALGTRHRATLFTLALAAAFATLHRLTGEDDLLIGVAGTHRRGSGMRGLVGLCVNTLPIRVDLSGDPSFTTLLERVRDAQLTAQEHGDVPFDLVLERLGATARDPDGTALVRCTADVLGEPTVLRLPGCTAEYVDIATGDVKFDLTFALRDTDRPAAVVRHGAALDEATAAALGAAHAALLAAVAADPSLPLSRLPAAASSAYSLAARHPAEEALLSHPAVAEAAVVHPDGGPLLAYAVLRGVSGPPPAELRAFLRGRLPEDRLPAAVTLLDALPRTPGGDPDRTALPGLPAAPAPTGPAAEAVTEGFRTLLGRAPGPDDDFFALGGGSLTAVRLAERLREALRLPLTGLDVLQARTPRALTALLATRAAERAAAAPTATRPRRPRTGAVLVTGATGGVGTFVLRELAARGRPVLALARPESAHLIAAAGLDGVDVLEGDLADPDGLRAAVREADAVVHAACTFTRHDTDLAAMAAMAGAWRRGPFVFVSSVDAYGHPGPDEITEDTPAAEPLSPYGRAKRDCEALLLRAAGTEGRGAARAVRAPLVWGAHDRLRDQLRWGATGSLYQAAAEGRPLVVPRPGAAGRPWYGAPWVHAAALARAVVSCLDAPVTGVANAVGGHVAWRDLAAELARLLGSTSEIHETDQVPQDLDHPWHYRADHLAPALHPHPGEDWRTTLATMTRPPAP
ncbi:condensation domain-containing protein [Streptomyces sp. LP05-1]|uniref:Condensation domain-containing protein n=1 Tax=Streptomyces pyxinae TaxID=2970734 RepID=A0ABT2CA76_9ACTN|nr:condensation domain-containing protein [Streptomyces sp. LP05-1]MCS0634266.1 condensation domain-containing protein [Streptomyces sp. LP05-1]